MEAGENAWMTGYTYRRRKMRGAAVLCRRRDLFPPISGSGNKAGVYAAWFGSVRAQVDEAGAVLFDAGGRGAGERNRASVAGA